MTTACVSPGTRHQDSSTMHSLGEISRARRVVGRLGGRFSRELGIDVDRGADEIERWALAATLIGVGGPLSASMRAYRALEQAGVETLADVRACDRERLAQLLFEGGYARSRETTASRLLALARDMANRYPEGLATRGEEVRDPLELERELCGLAGWDRTIVLTFLRDLRRIWLAAAPPLDPRAASAARHVALPPDLRRLSEVAGAAHLDVRDLEAGLTRLALSHDFVHCAGGEECPLAEADREQFVHF